MKEFTGHRSDAVDAYQVTSHEQRQSMSEVVQGLDKPNVVKKSEESEQNVAKVIETASDMRKCQCNCKNVNEHNVAEIVTELLKASKGKGKTTIKIEVEINNE